MLRETLKPWLSLRSTQSQSKPPEVAALEEIYGTLNPATAWSFLARHFPQATTSELLSRWETDPTCTTSTFGREPNLGVIIESLAQTAPSTPPVVLCVGCGYGPEAQELALRATEQQLEQVQIHGIDVSPTQIEAAVSHRVLYFPEESYEYEAAFLERMLRKGLLHTDSTEYLPHRQRTIEHCHLSAVVTQHLQYAVHDIISEPFALKEASVVVCNNLLFHYPAHTRDLMLIHMLQSLASDGLLFLEARRSLAWHRTQEKKWLQPYYEWQNTLHRFGLQPAAGFPPETVVYRYMTAHNQYGDHRYVIREQRLVQI